MTRPTTAELPEYFLYLGSLGFGGPVALVDYMQHGLVEQRKWFTRDEYMKSLALSQLAPGPLAAPLARRFKVPEPILIAAGAAAGLVIFSLR